MLKNKVIIVTGGSGLLGRGILGKLTANEAIAVNADVNVQNDKAACTVYCDITNEKSIDEMLAWVNETYGSIDGIVNNAYPRTSDWANKFENITVESWQKNVDWQLNSIFTICQKIIPYFQQKGKGTIVNMGSIYGAVAPDFTVYDGTSLTSPAAYSAIKGGIINFTRYLAAYLGPQAIRVNCVSPGGIFDNQHPVFVTNYSHKVPMRRMGNPEDIAGPVAFLLSDDAGYITGQNLLVDGGWTCI
jgi:NAD(P)-dependent dehydrogenase (short-subunit alcohol dehydrogenase family)